MATKYPRTGFNPMSQKPLAARHADRHSAGLAVRFVATFRQSLMPILFRTTRCHSPSWRSAFAESAVACTTFVK
jgi:hypothetical protein